MSTVETATTVDSQETRRRWSVAPYVVFLILVGATIPWRSKSYFEGGLDIVVVVKAGLSVTALGLAVLVTMGREVRPLRAGPVVLLMLYLGGTVLGAWTTGSLGPSAVIAVRVAMLAAAVVILARAFDGPMLLGSLLLALVTFAVPAIITGLGSLADGRLSGGLPPLHSNEIASTCALVILWCLWLIANGQDRWLHVLAIGAAFLVLVATGSRTPLVAMTVAAIFIVASTRLLRLRTLIVALATMPVVLWLVTGTDLLQGLLLRGEDAGKLDTLNSRTIAWQAAFAPQESIWATWFGGGLEMKHIVVQGQYWEQQILDSSWVSALVQGGLLGLVLCGAWVLASLASTRNSDPQLRVLQLTLLTYLALRGFLESGLFDASTAFLMFFAVTMTIPLPRYEQDATSGTTLAAALELSEPRTVAATQRP